MLEPSSGQLGVDHPDQAAQAEFEAGADLKSVVKAHVQSGWAWSALAAAALAGGDPVSAYSHAALGRGLSLQALHRDGWTPGQPVSDAFLLAVMVWGLACEALGEPDLARRAQGLLAQSGHDLHDDGLLERLARLAPALVPGALEP
ncbi:MAG: DUF3151 family protein [Bifidobacteriaceae bacterium]|jgi:hypothetical protein|nr:DUF3151 family protein [Bifidobacteriaceae bacterium]